MRRSNGVVTILTGLIAAGFGLWVWARHMHTVGLSVTVIRGPIVVAFADVLLIGGGAYVLNRPS